jgi:hypothetical protein
MIVHTLERCSIDNHVSRESSGWVLAALRDIGIPFNAIYETYHQLSINKVVVDDFIEKVCMLI